MEARNGQKDSIFRINKNWLFDSESGNCYIVRYTKSNEIDSVWQAFHINSSSGPNDYIEYVKFVDGIPIGVLRRVAKLLQKSEGIGYLEREMIENEK